MNRTWVTLIYNLLLPVVLLVGLPRFLIKGLQRGGLARNFGQRFGRYDPATREKLEARSGEGGGGDAGSIWVHAVSVGEVLVALKVIRSLQEREPERRIVLSTTTTTGFDLAEKEATDGVTVIHNPVDLPFVVRRALDLVRPERLVLVEAEVWPNLVRQVRARGVPVTLVNARLSDRSERRFRRFSALTRPVFQQLDRVCVAFETDIARWEALGVERDRIELTGSVKFDQAESAVPSERIDDLRQWLGSQGIDLDRARILLAGSTHAGEEALIGRVWQRLRERFPEIIFIAVPRHAERGRAAAAQLRESGLDPVLRNPVSRENGPAPESEAGEHGNRCYVANTTGELRAWYHLAEVVVIGKSLIGRGGQNPVEPIVAGKPVVAGPSMGNFTAIVASLARHDGILQLDTAEEEELEGCLTELFEDPAAATAIADRGIEVVRRHRGAADRTADAVLSTPSPAG